VPVFLRFLKPVISCAVFIAILLSSSAFGEKKNCEKLLSKTARIVALPITWPAKKIKNAVQKFATEYWWAGKHDDPAEFNLLNPEDPRPFNYFNARIYGPLRDEPEKFRLRNYLVATDVLSRYRIRRHGSPPIQRRPGLMINILMTLLIVDQIDKGVVALNNRGFEAAQSENIYGAHTIQEWMATGAIDPDLGKNLFNRFKTEFAQNLFPLRQRTKDFVKNGWWSPEAGEIANSILDDLVKQNKPEQLYRTEMLAEKITQHPRYRDLTLAVLPENAFTVTLWLTPQVEFRGHPDTYWIAQMLNPTGLTDSQVAGLASLRPYFQADLENASLVVDIELIAMTLADHDKIEAKIKKAEALSLPSSRGTFARVDLPPFAQKRVFSDGKIIITLNDEIDRWNLIYKDPRFVGFKNAWLNQTLTDQQLLLASELFLESGAYRFAPPTKALDLKASCQLIFGDKDLPSVPMFSNLKRDIGNIPLEQRDRLALARLKIYIDAFLKASRTPEKWDEIFSQNNADDKALVEKAMQGEFPPEVSGTCSNP
jgi:hypothetical protein